MPILLYNIFKAFLLFIKFLNFIINYKIFLNKNKIYYMILFYAYKVKLYNIFLLFIKFNNNIIRIFNASRIIKNNFIYNLKKYNVNLNLGIFINKFFIFKFFSKSNICKPLYNQIILKQFYIKQNFNYLKNNFYDKFINIFFYNKFIIYNKFSFVFFVGKFNNKKNINLNKANVLKNLFSLFFFNLFIYFLFVYLFIF